MMPVIERKALHGKISASIRYITNPDKTDGEMLVSSINCSVSSAAQEMKMTRRKFHINSTDDRIGYHIIQSFNHEDDITPEQAHEIAEKLVKELYPDHEAVIATHIDKLHLHNHIVINSISIEDGKKLNDKLSDEKGSLYRLRDVSNLICKEYGCRIMEDRTITRYSKNKFDKYIMSQRQLDIQHDLEECIENSESFEMVFNKMRDKNYRIRILDDVELIKIKHPDRNDKRWYNINDFSNGQYSYSNLKSYYSLYYEQSDKNMIEFINDEVFLNKIEREIPHYRNIDVNNESVTTVQSFRDNGDFYIPPVGDSILNETPPPDYNDMDIDGINDGISSYDEYEIPDIFYDIPIPSDDDIPLEFEEEMIDMEFNINITADSYVEKEESEQIQSQDIFYEDNDIPNVDIKYDEHWESLLFEVPPDEIPYEQERPEAAFSYSPQLPDDSGISEMTVSVIDDSYLDSLAEMKSVETEADREYEQQMSFLNKRNFAKEPETITTTLDNIQKQNDRTIIEIAEKVLNERKEYLKKNNQSTKRLYPNVISLERNKRYIKNKAMFRLEAEERYRIFSESKTADLITSRHLYTYEDIANERIKLMYDIDKFQDEVFKLKKQYHRKDVIGHAINLYTMYYRVYQKYLEQKGRGDNKMLITYKDELAKFNGASSYLKKIYELEDIDIKDVRRIHTSLSSIIQRYNQGLDIVKRKIQELNVLNDFTVEYDINNRENVTSFSFARKRISSFNDSEIKKISEMFPDYPQNSIKVVIPYLDDCVGIFDARDVVNRSGEACKLYLDRDSNYLIYDKNGNEMFYTGSSLTDAIEKAKEKATRKYKNKNYDKENRYASRFTINHMNNNQNEKVSDEIQKENL